MITTEQIKSKIQGDHAPQSIVVEDISWQHAGHNPAAKKGGTHFKITIKNTNWAALTRVQIHRKIHGSLDPFFAGGLHAFTLKIQTD